MAGLYGLVIRSSESAGVLWGWKKTHFFASDWAGEGEFPCCSSCSFLEKKNSLPILQSTHYTITSIFIYLQVALGFFLTRPDTLWITLSAGSSTRERFFLGIRTLTTCFVA